jgi:hypothetical protein
MSIFKHVKYIYIYIYIYPYYQDDDVALDEVRNPMSSDGSSSKLYTDGSSAQL